MKGWQIRGGERVVLEGQVFYVRSVMHTIGNVIYLDTRDENGCLVEKDVETESEVEVL